MVKKAISLLVAGVLAASAMAAFALPATAEEEQFKMAYDFEGFDVGFRLGDANDKGKTGELPYIKTNEKTGTMASSFDLTIVEGGYNGKALEYKSLMGLDGIYTPLVINLTESPNTGTDFDGATNFIFYVDMTGWGEDRGIRPVIYEEDYDAADEATGQETAWYPDKNKPFYIEDGKGGWTAGSYQKNDSDDSGTIMISATYKGFVKIPIDSFIKPEWSKTDANSKFDCKHVTAVALEVGCYGRNDGNMIVFDEIGFSGTFANNGVTFPELKGTAGADVSGAILSGGSGTDASTGGTDASGAASENSTQTNTSTSGDKDKDSSGSMDTTTIILIVVAAVVLIGAVIAIFLITKKGKNTPTDGGDASVESPSEDGTNNSAE